jgi:aconitate hydratase A / 2-methylisocitrate dehydratase
MSIHNVFNSLREFDRGEGKRGFFYSLPALEEAGIGNISRLPVSIRIILESVLRNIDGKKVTERDVRTLANWNAKAPASEEIPFIVARIVLQDFTGVPLLVDLAAMRTAVARLNNNPAIVEPLVPVDLVVDHSVQVDFFGTPEALKLNLEMEFKRNRERYQLLKWGQQAFKTFKVVPPGIGIVHQVNLEYLAKGVLSAPATANQKAATIFYPDTLVGTDSHTTMINGLGIVGWGVGGIEAEAGMLGQPVYFLTPEVIGVQLTGALREGVTATDLALHVTQMLRKEKVVGKFVEFFGEGAASLPVADRATIANMAPEYGATMGYFPVDDESLNYLRATGRTNAEVVAFGNYFKAQNMFGISRPGEIDYSRALELDLTEVQPSVAGPKRPQDRIELPRLKEAFVELFSKPLNEGGYNKPRAELGKHFEVDLHDSANAPTGGGSQELTADGRAGSRWSEAEMINNRPTPDRTVTPVTGANGRTEIRHGSVVIAAITSCTNTSNPSVMLGAGLLAKKAIERGMSIPAYVKTSLAPGSRVVSDYLAKTGLQPYLDRLGFNLVGYGCTTCIGNSGPLPAPIENAITQNDVVVASVLSGNRNFEARVHSSVKANFLMSPPLVVAFALAGRVDIDLTNEPLGKDKDGQDVYLRELWPTLQEIRVAMAKALKPEVFRALYKDFAAQNPAWNDIPASVGAVYQWDANSTYIQDPPFFEGFSMQSGTSADIRAARALGIFGDSVTTDHISPAGSIKKDSPAGKYLMEHGVQPVDFNSYGARRGNDRVMTRGTFANVRIKNLLVPGTEGGVTKHDGNVMPIYEAAMKYQQAGVPLVIFAGQEYGTGSSRDWAAKGTRLLGVRAVIAASFERIHRSNLVGMGVLPCQFKEGTNAQTLGLDGSETFDLLGIADKLKPRQELTLVIHRSGGDKEEVPVICRIDTPIEVEYYRHGGILPFVLRQLLAKNG